MLNAQSQVRTIIITLGGNSNPTEREREREQINLMGAEIILEIFLVYAICRRRRAFPNPNRADGGVRVSG